MHHPQEKPLSGKGEEEEKLSLPLNQDPAKCVDLSEMDLVLTEEAEASIEKKIKHYYRMKATSLQSVADGIGYCVWCNGSFDIRKAPQFKGSYDTSTCCRTLEIVCPAKPSCNKGEKIVFGVVFNLEEMLREQKKKIEDLKRRIILNKNDLMFGYKERKDAIAYHDTTVAQLKGITDTYVSRLYKYLSYTNNEKLNQEIEKVDRDITTFVKEIKLFLTPESSASTPSSSSSSAFSPNIEKEAIEAAVKAALHIKEDYACIQRLKGIQEKGYKEYLFNCESKFVENEKEIVTEKKKRSREKSVIESSERKRERELEKFGKVESKEEKKEKKMIEKIQKEITHLYDTYEIFDELLQNDPEYYEQTEKEIAELIKLLKRQGTEAQKKEFHDIHQMYLEKFIKMEEDKRKKEQEDKDRIQTMLTSGENDEELKKQIEEDMEEL
jgi:hypothetical protein